MKALPSFVREEIAAAGAILQQRWQAYRLVLPGDASFICQPATCDAHCCRAFSVSLGEHEVARMTTSSGLIPADFLEIEDGRPVTLPLAQPYLLARSDNRCALLGESLACTQYHGRPNACRLYPHFVVAFDRQAARPLRSADAPLSRLVEDALEGRLGNTLPLLLRHTECPGFTGPPLDASAWGRLFLDTALLQEAVDLPAVEPSSALR